MDNEKNIGKKVWKLEGDICRGFHLVSRKNYTLIAVKPNEGEYAEDILTIKDNKGNVLDVSEYECVFVPKRCSDISSKVHEYLKDNGLYPTDTWKDGEECVVVGIDGDWKHDHGWCRCLMNYLGYVEGDEVVTEENGSDWYGANHYFYKKAN